MAVDKTLPSTKEVEKFHANSDKDGSITALHHTLGPRNNQASPGNHTHDGGQSSDLDALLASITVTGSRGGNAALTSLLLGLSTKFGLVDGTTA